MRIFITNATADVGVAAARALRRAGFEVHGVDSRRVPRIMASRYFDGYRCIVQDDPLRWQEEMLGHVAQLRADVFLPLCNPGAVLAVQRRSDLQSICHVNAPDTTAFLAAFDKRLCMRQCSALGIPCAGSLSRDEAVALLLGEGNRSVLVKPGTDVSAGRGLHHATDVDGLDEAIRRCEAHHGSCVIQEYIPGDDDSLRMVTVVYARGGRLLGAFTARKLRQWPPSGGVTAYGVSTRDHGLLDLVRPFFDHLRWRGPAEVELKHDPRDGAFKVLEINPRLPGNVRHASLCGVEPVVWAVRACLGESADGPTTLPAYPLGVAYLAPTVYLKSVVHDIRVRGCSHALARAGSEVATAAPMLRSLLSDPLPIVTRALVPSGSHRIVPFPSAPTREPSAGTRAD